LKGFGFMDFAELFTKYQKLVAMADAAFQRVNTEYPEEVKCTRRCADCCHALFDLSLIEALYINTVFNERFQGSEKAAILEKANAIDRKIYKMKRKAFKEFKTGKKEEHILADMAIQRARCPLLGDDDLCILYDARPITCRFYGIPTAIGGTGHTCGLSGFKAGDKYPTVNLDIIHQRLYEISSELVALLKARHVALVDMLIPLSMALLTTFDQEFFGLADADADADADAEQKEDPRQQKEGSG
jgi:Fe-S-cluster containining protein